MSNHAEEISKFLPHREPFLFIDEIVDIELGKKIHCIKRNSQMKIILGVIFQITQLCQELLF